MAPLSVKAIDLSNDAGNAKTAVIDANGNLVVIMWLDTTVDSSGQPVAVYSTKWRNVVQFSNSDEQWQRKIFGTRE